jgi:hypothetical protein
LKSKKALQKLPRAQFTSIHGWIPLPLFGSHTSPGAIELHRFFVEANSQVQEVSHMAKIHHAGTKAVK